MQVIPERAKGCPMLCPRILFFGIAIGASLQLCGVQFAAAADRPARLGTVTTLAMIPAGDEPRQTYTLTHSDSPQTREGATSLLIHHSRTYPATPNNCWVAPQVDERLPLELIPSFSDGKLTARVIWLGTRQAGIPLTADLANGKRIVGRSDGSGDFTVEASEPGRYTFRCEQTEKVAGERDGKKYTSVVHQTTLVVIVSQLNSAGLPNVAL
jgi:hypothetical protein